MLCNKKHRARWHQVTTEKQTCLSGKSKDMSRKTDLRLRKKEEDGVIWAKWGENAGVKGRGDGDLAGLQKGKVAGAWRSGVFSLCILRK